MRPLRFDWIVAIVAACLTAGIGGMYWLNDREGNSLALEIAQITPENGSNPPGTTEIKIDFREPMDKTSVKSRFEIQPPVSGQFRWEGNAYILTPNRPFLSNTSYTVRLTSGIQTLKGRQTSRSIEWSFKPRPPSIVYLNVDLGSPQHIIRIQGINGGDPRILYTSPDQILDFSVSPSGQQLAISVLNANGKAEIHFIDTTNGKDQGTMPCAPASCSGAVWSPDGKLIVYARNETSLIHLAGLDRVWLYDPASGQTQPVFEDNQILGTNPIWSANGASLALIDQNAKGIHVANLSEKTTYFVYTFYLGGSGSLSPDGKQLAYTNMVAANGRFADVVYLANLNAKLTNVPLVQDSTYSQSLNPVWSPDGKWIAYLRGQVNQPESMRVVLYQVGSGKFTQVTNASEFGETFWNSTGQYLLLANYPPNQEKFQPEIWAYDVSANHLWKVVSGGIKGQWLP